MSLKRPSGPLSSFTVRLSLWYALVFTISAGILFWLLYLLLAAALERKAAEAEFSLRIGLALRLAG